MLVDAIGARLCLRLRPLIIQLNVKLNMIAISRTNFHCKTLAMLSKRDRLRNRWCKRTHCDCESSNPVNEAVLMEIHDERILSDFLLSMKKGACAPFSFEIAIASVFYASAVFFLPMILPINGQNSRTNARVVIAPTK